MGRSFDLQEKVRDKVKCSSSSKVSIVTLSFVAVRVKGLSIEAPISMGKVLQTISYKNRNFCILCVHRYGTRRQTCWMSGAYYPCFQMSAAKQSIRTP